MVIQGPDAHLQITVHALDGEHFMVRTSPESTEQIFGASHYVATRPVNGPV